MPSSAPDSVAGAAAGEVLGEPDDTGASAPASPRSEESSDVQEAPGTTAGEVPVESGDVRGPAPMYPRGEEAVTARARLGLAVAPHVSAVPLPQMLHRLSQVEAETKVVALGELEALEVERQCLSD